MSRTGPLRLVVFASGQGFTLQALLDAIAAGQLAASVAAVCSDRPGAPVLDRARAAGIDIIALSPRAYPDRAAFDRALFAAARDRNPELTVLAGYMRIIDPDVVAQAYPDMINLHPSLLPKYPGLGTHARALAAGDREHGASVHMVIPELDAGPVLARVRVPVRPGDDPQTLAARVRGREQPLLVACIDLITRGRLRLRPHGPELDGAALVTPLELDRENRLEPMA